MSASKQTTPTKETVKKPELVKKPVVQETKKPELVKKQQSAPAVPPKQNEKYYTTKDVTVVDKKPVPKKEQMQGQKPTTPYITFKNEAPSFEPSKQTSTPEAKKYVSNIDEARKVLKGRNVYNLPPANTLEGQQARNKQANSKHKGYLSGALRDAKNSFKYGNGR